jgi:hypothetical protein
MPPHRAHFSIALALLAVFAACSTEKKPAMGDTAVASPVAAGKPLPEPVNTGWQESIAGPALILPVPDNSAAVSVVLPMMNDSTLSVTGPVSVDSFQGMSIDLFDRSGTAGSVTLGRGIPSAVAEGCIAWPVLSLRDASPRTWQVGFKTGTVAAIPLDSLEGVTSSDSSFVTTELARLASALPVSNDPVFRGLPFNVRKAYRSKSGPTSILVGDIVRKINEEANPREEHLLLIAEPGPDSGHYTTVFHSRTAGSEEAVRTSDVLAAVRFIANKRDALVVSFEYENGTRVTLIERASGGWKVTWRSAYTGC